MKAILVLGLLVLAFFVPGSSAQTVASSADSAMCAPPLPVVATANIGAGYINYCVYYPRVVLPGSTFSISSTMTAPATVLAGFNTAASAFTPVSGCTEGTPAMVVPTVNGVVGTMVSFVSTLTMTGEQCDAATSITLQVAAAPVQIYAQGLVINIRTENVRVDNFNYLCDAPGITPNAYATTSTVCNDPTIALSGTLNAVLSGTVALSGTLTVADDGNGWVIHQDPISGELTVCPETAPCYHELSGTINTNTNVSIMGNVSVNSTVLPPEPEPEGWDGSLYIFLLIFAAFLIWAGETRRDNWFRAFAGLILLIASFVAIWEMDRVGFNNFGMGAKLVLAFMAIEFPLGFYLLVPKNWKEKENEN